MLPKTHLIFGAIFSLLVYLLFPELGWNSLIILAATVLIDIDHYFVSVILTQKLNPWHAYTFFKANYKVDGKLNYELYAFHTLEFYILIFVLSFSYKTFLLISGGISLHILLDLIPPIHKKHKSILVYFFNKKHGNKK